LGRLLMFCLLLVAFCCALERQSVPRSVLGPGLLVASALAVFFPWPWPQRADEAIFRAIPGTLEETEGFFRSGGRFTGLREETMVQGCPRSGMQPWPVWRPLPAWLSAASWQL